MKPMIQAKPSFLIPAVLCLLMAFYQRAEAVQELSNLGDVWTSGGIGDIHGLFPGGNPYGSDEAHFITGAGRFSLNSITLEFEYDSGYPAGLAALQRVNIQLFQQVGAVNTLLGTFGNPVADSVPTQWPKLSNPNAYTTYFDFTPSGLIGLNSFSEYSLVVSMPANSPVDAALIFTASSAYTSPDGWAMDVTTSGNPSATGEYLKLAVNATPIPDGANTAVLLGGGSVLLLGYHKKIRRKHAS